LRERLQYFALEPQRVLLCGCDLASLISHLMTQLPQADIFAIDRSGTQMPSARSQWWPRRQRLHSLRANALALPLKTHAVDLVFMNLLLPGCRQPDQVLTETARVLRPGGLLLLSSLGPASLPELATIDGQFPDLPQLAGLLQGTGFVEPVIDVEQHGITYASTSVAGEELAQLALGTSSPHLVPPSALTFELVVAAAFAGPASPARMDIADGEVTIAASTIGRRSHR
jgi:malonyl-CoA O-methyltransferase